MNGGGGEYLCSMSSIRYSVYLSIPLTCKTISFLTLLVCNCCAKTADMGMMGKYIKTSPGLELR